MHRRSEGGSVLPKEISENQKPEMLQAAAQLDSGIFISM